MSHSSSSSNKSSSSTSSVLASAMSVLSLPLYRLPDGAQYLARFDATEALSHVHSKVSKATAASARSMQARPSLNVILVVDRSGSMGSNAERIASRILPALITLLPCSADSLIHTIAFSGGSTESSCTAKEFLSSPPKLAADGSTYMAPAIQIILQRLQQPSFYLPAPFRIVTFSDGELHDQDATVQMVERLHAALQIRAQEVDYPFHVSSHAVRFFTSSADPDTRGLSSMLRLNTVGAPLLIDCNSSQSDEILVQQLSEAVLGASGELGNTLTLKAVGAKFTPTPWNKPSFRAHTEIPFSVDMINHKNSSSFSSTSKAASNSDTVFWFDGLPSKVCIQIPGVEDAIELQLDASRQLTESIYDSVVLPSLSSYLSRLRLLKVVNSGPALQEAQEQVSFFQMLESVVSWTGKDLVSAFQDSSLRARLAHLRERVLKSQRGAVMQMQNIVNNDRVTAFNAAQLADYLRGAGAVSSNSNRRALAKRAMANETKLDFDEALRKEIRQMSEHFKTELADIDDRNHQVSFFSQETTLAGIRALVSLVPVDEIHDDGVFDALSAHDFLNMANIVGVACAGPIGDFPDPMTWRIDHIWPGAYLSMSDVIVAHSMNVGRADASALKAPGSSIPITSVVPFFDDVRIQNFLSKHAPILLQLSCGLGMRRVLADITYTTNYTLAAGLWKLAEDIYKNPTEIGIKTFVQLQSSYDLLLGNQFAHVSAVLHEQKDNAAKGLSYWLCNNGATNIMNPLSLLCKKYRANPHEKPQLQSILPRILRALYSYEIYSAVRRFHKNGTNSVEYCENALYEMLSIDFNEYKTPLPVLFEAPTSISELQHRRTYQLNTKVLAKYVQSFWYVHYTLVLPLLYQCSEDVEEIRALVKSLDLSSDATKKHLLGLPAEYSFDQFIFYNVFQALLFHEKKLRLDDDVGVMKIIDVGDEKAASIMVEDWVSRQYSRKYQSEMRKQKVEELRMIADKWIQSFLAAEDLPTTCNLFQRGMKVGYLDFKLENTAQIGFQELKDRLVKLCSSDEEITKFPNKFPKAAIKVAIFLTGQNPKTNEELWNHGHLLPLTALSAFHHAIFPNSTCIFDKLAHVEAKAIAVESGLQEDLEKEDENEMKVESKTASSSSSSSRLTYAQVAAGKSSKSLGSNIIAVPHLRVLQTMWSLLVSPLLKTQLHVYRDSPELNRHGHGNNHPSYFAFGYGTLEEMRKTITEEEWKKYKEEHSNCCGVPLLMDKDIETKTPGQN